jgi:hypothetical protein
MKSTLTVLVVVFSAVLGGLQRHTVSPLDLTQQRGGPRVDEKCHNCLDFGEKYLKDLFEIITSGGEFGTCAELCHLLGDKVHTTGVYEVCLVLCTVADVATFIEFLRKVELNEFYFCDLLKRCPTKDDGDANIYSLRTVPKDVKQNTSFEVVMVFTTKAGTGLGQFDLNITTGGVAVERDNATVDPIKTGDYSAKWTLFAPLSWSPGNYTVGVALCYGKCWSHVPHSEVYASGKANFNISGSG